jgi:hypothetical protein
MFILTFQIRIKRIIQDPTFVLLGEAFSERPGAFSNIRLKLAARMGGRADDPHPVVGGKTPLEIAREGENLEFLRRAARYASEQHVRSVFETACKANQTTVIQVLQEEYPHLECDRP